MLEKPIKATVRYNHDCPGLDVMLTYSGNRYLALHLDEDINGEYQASCVENLLKICIEGQENGN